MKILLPGLTLAIVALYYGLLAFAPSLLAGRIAGWPLSILLALASFSGLFILAFAGSLKRDDDV
ncbi:hypothetical protein [Craterilacuibacter sp.]|uniref:hypothetical protein n=1 Tax=Craterilacuibacter sp. TaxID=2870909 RepID=UPI003F3CFEBB